MGLGVGVGFGFGFGLGLGLGFGFGLGVGVGVGLPEPTKVTRTSILGSVHFLCHSHRPFSAQYSRGARRLTCHGGGLWAKAAGAEKCGRGVAGVWGCGARFGLRRLGLRGVVGAWRG